MKKPSALIISTKRWPIPARLALALANAGFRVAAISPSKSFVNRTHAVHRRYSYQLPNSIVRAIDDWCPDLLICADDQSVNELHGIHRQASSHPESKGSAKLISLIERSLGAPHGFEFAAKKSKFLSLATSLGVRCPPTAFITRQNIESQIKSTTYPILVKADGSWGGRLVRIVESPDKARTTIREFQLPSSWPSSLRELLARVVPPWINRSKPPESLGICLQQFVQGSPANRAVVCWEGQVLAGLSARVHKTVYTFGPASLVEIIDLPEMTDVTNRLVNHLNLSGFIGFDFVLDPEDHAWLIEMNPRVTPLSYLGHSGTDLAAALYAKLTGINPATQPAAREEKLIALFPQELQRAYPGGFASAGYDDVPWEDPALVLALLNSVTKTGLSKRLGMRRRNRQNSLIRRLQQNPSEP